MKHILLVIVLLASMSAHAACSAQGWLHLTKASSIVWCPKNGPMEWSVTYDASRGHIIVVNSLTNNWWYFPLSYQTTYQDTFIKNGIKIGFKLKTYKKQGDWMLVSLSGD